MPKNAHSYHVFISLNRILRLFVTTCCLVIFMFSDPVAGYSALECGQATQAMPCLRALSGVLRGGCHAGFGIKLC